MIFPHFFDGFLMEQMSLNKVVNKRENKKKETIKIHLGRIPEALPKIVDHKSLIW